MSTIHSEQNIAYICKLLHESIQLPVFCFGDNEHFNNLHFSTNPQFTDHQQLIQSVVKHTHNSKFPILYTTNFLEHFIVVPVKKNDEWIGTIMIGPAISHLPTQETLSSIMNDNHVPSKQLKQWTDYWFNLPNVPKLRLFHISMLAHFMVNGESLEMTDVVENNFHFVERFTPEDHFDVTLSERREFSTLHSNPDIEKWLLRHIKQGNKTEVLNLMTTTSQIKYGVLAKRSHLRNRKNLAICAIAITTRAAMEGGLYAELAYTLSDLHIQHIEELKDVQSVEVAIIDAMLDFTERVRQSKKSSVSKQVEACQEYIFNHLYEDIPLLILSELAGLNGHYLSHLFKKETGVSISHFIQKERVEEAKKLLDFTKDPVSTISSRLNFYDQTYFIKVFKKHTGMTPKQYKTKSPLQG